MSLQDARLPSLRDKLEAEAILAEEKVENEDKKSLKKVVIIKKKSKKNNE